MIITVYEAYLLILWGRIDNVGHEHRQQFSHTMYTSTISAVWSRSTRLLSGLTCLIYPMSSYRVYDVENAKFVGARGFLEVGKYFLDQDGFGL